MNNVNLKRMFKKLILAVGITSSTAIFVKKTRTYNKTEYENPFYGKKVAFVQDDNDAENADGVKGHLTAAGESNYVQGFYEKYIKRGIDVILSFLALIILSPIFIGIALAIVIDDPGPVLFTQKRLGQNKCYFKLHKFRSMKMATPHDVPTHMLDNPEQYITHVGKFLRKHSLDELPQIWDIFVGNMSIIGPRPGLWNQDILTAERDKYNANDVKPGLTGWAQINGRDELEIPDKAKLDGEYVKNLGLKMDIKCFLGSLGVFVNDSSVIEGGTGSVKRNTIKNYSAQSTNSEIIGQIGFGETVQIDLSRVNKILITGAGSYIGESFATYAAVHYGEYIKIDTLDMLNDSWKDKDFSEYDAIFHVAGIAHADIGKVNNSVRKQYYAINTDLAIEVCKKAKQDGVRKFVFMSSMIVYGDSAPYGRTKIINEHTLPEPANFYGDSKLQADITVRKLANENFKVIVLRPPMIYGSNSRGNYPILAKIANNTPVFPDIKNQRSMLYIDNLCEFLCQIMLIKHYKRNAIVLFPQNAEWTKTSNMVAEISKVNRRKIKMLKGFAPLVLLGSRIPGRVGNLMNKAFGNFTYAMSMSKYDGIDYQKISLEQSIRLTEEGTL